MTTQFTTATQSLITLAAVLGLRPATDPKPYRGSYRVVLNGKGEEAGFGAIYVGARTGKVIRMHLRYGNTDERPARYITHEGYLKSLHTLRDSYHLYARCADVLPKPEPAPKQAMVVTSGSTTWNIGPGQAPACFGCTCTGHPAGPYCMHCEAAHTTSPRGLCWG